MATEIMEQQAKQAREIAAAIANVARVAREMTAQAVEAAAGSPEESADLTCAAGHLMSQAGWLADRLAQMFGDPGVLGAAEDWMLPPSYHQAAEEGA